jgi:transketolase
MSDIDKLRRRILDVAYRDNMGHIPSALSILDLIWCLYNKIMTKDDQFILSKGHGVMALYAVLEEKGLLDWSKRLMGHPKRGGEILASTGSLGHGLPMAVGLALAKKIKNEPGRVYCLIGDGECNEGTTWESAMVAAHHKLNNLVVIVDQNHSSDRALDTGDLRKKFNVFGFNSFEIAGHEAKRPSTIDKRSYKITMNSLKYAQTLEEVIETKNEKNPKSIVCNTIKGNGIPFMQENSWHNKKLSEEDYNKAISCLK